MARYDYIVAKYGTAKYENFMNRDITPLASGHMIVNVASNTMIIVVVVSSIVAIASVGAYFMLRRKRYIK